MDISHIEEKIRGHVPQIMNTKRANAVLIPLVEDKDGVCILFEKRSMSVWQPGEICFPGGGIEPGETAEDAAVRETMEELGIPREDIQVLAPFDVKMGLGGFLLHSFVAQVKMDHIKFDRDEVAEVFTVPIKWLLDNEPQRFQFIMKPGVPSDFDMSVFGIEGEYNWRTTTHELLVWKYKNYHIWGLTGEITDKFIRFITC